MAMRLHPHRVRGRLSNREHNVITGELQLWPPRSEESPNEWKPITVEIKLTGNLSGSLKSRSFEFESTEAESPAPVPLPESLHSEQVGEAGDCFWQEVHGPRLSVEAVHEGIARGETPPVDRGTSLHLEWFSHNGHVVLEVINPVLNFIDDAPPAVPSPLPVIDANDLDRPIEKDDALNPGQPGERRAWSDVIPGLDPKIEAMYEQWDEITDGSKDEPIRNLIEGPLHLPKPQDVQTEEEAGAALDTLLDAMADHGVNLTICDHYTDVEAYRLLVEELLDKIEVHPEQADAGWVSYYDTFDLCEKCQAEFI